MSSFHTEVLSGSHKLVPRNGCPEFESVCVCVCVCVREAGREGGRENDEEQQTRNGKFDCTSEPQ